MSLILPHLTALYVALLPFFGVKLFGLLMLLLAFDYATGILRAVAEHRYDNLRLAVSPFKAALYLIYYTVTHSIVLYISGGLIQLPPGLDELLLLLPVAKEAVSVLQNLKAIAVVNQMDASWLDVIIKFMRLDVYQSALDKLQKAETAAAPGPEAVSEPQDKPEAAPTGDRQ